MVVEHRVQGYEAFLKFMKDFKSDEPTFVLYVGADTIDSEPWCSDCVEADPFIEKGFELLSDTNNLIIVSVGGKLFWKDLKCPFRTNPEIHIAVLPTLVKWGTQQRLEGGELLDTDLIKLLLTNDD